MAQKNEKILILLQCNLIKNLYPKRLKNKNTALLVYPQTYHPELQVDCNTFFTSIVRYHKVIDIFYLVFRTTVLIHLMMISF